MSSRKKLVNEVFLKKSIEMPEHPVNVGNKKVELYHVIIGGLLGLISVLIALGYDHIVSNIKDIKDGVKRLETQQNINTNFITNIKHKIKDVRTTLTSLDGHTYYGKCVLYYKRHEPKGHQTNRICSLNGSYPWKCESAVRKSYLHKKILLSIGDPNNSIEFKVVGFFYGGSEDGRMVQISKDALIELLGEKKGKEYINKGVIDSIIYFKNY